MGNVSTVVLVLFFVLGLLLLAAIGVAIFYLVKLLKLGKAVRSDLMPLKGKVAFWGGLIYAISPLDLLPDPIYLDDAAMLMGVVAFVQQLAERYGVLDTNPLDGSPQLPWRDK